MMEALKFINLALAFILELAMLAAFAYWGFHAGNSMLARLSCRLDTPSSDHSTLTFRHQPYMLRRSAVKI